jgi:putative membrane protein
MAINAIFAFLHFVAAISVVFTVIYERLNFKKQLTNIEAKRLQKVDSIYGLSAMLVLIIGFLRVYFFEKGSSYYFSNTFFWIKLGLFAIVGLLSIYPTIRFLKWKKIIQNDEDVELGDGEYRKIKMYLNLEVVGLVLILMSASLMAKGINF